MLIDFYLWCPGTEMLYRGAAMHSLVCLCLVNAIFKCWGGINALWNTEHIECLYLYFILYFLAEAAGRAQFDSAYLRIETVVLLTNS